jgi:hypothetical protein
VGAGAAIFDLAIDVADIVRDDVRRNNAGLINVGWIDLGRGFDRDDVAGFNGQYRLQRGIEMSDMHGLRTWHQRMFGCVRAWHQESDRGRNNLVS